MNYLKTLLLVSVIVLFGDSLSESFAKNPAVYTAWFVIIIFGIVVYSVAKSNRKVKP